MRRTGRIIACFLADIEIFVVQANAKAGFKVAVDHALAPVSKNATASEAPVPVHWTVGLTRYFPMLCGCGYTIFTLSIERMKIEHD